MNRNTQLVLCCILGIFAVAAKARLQSEGIIGGDEAVEGSFPYHVSLSVSGRFLCGGSIIGRRHVVTAAHCVADSSGVFAREPMRVVAGIVDFQTNSQKRIVVDVTQVFIPKEYAYNSPYYRPTGDIAVIKLKSDLDLGGNQNIAKLDLPVRGKTYAGVKAWISGFGYNHVDVVKDQRTSELTEANGWSYMKMRYAEANVLSQVGCQMLYEGIIKIKHICASLVQRDARNPEGVCSGDSGGPLVYDNTLIGVVSTSPLGCVEDRQPAVYTRVSEYLDFIEKATRGIVDSTMLYTYL